VVKWKYIYFGKCVLLLTRQQRSEFESLTFIEKCGVSIQTGQKQRREAAVWCVNCSYLYDGDNLTNVSLFRIVARNPHYTMNIPY
jgi:hypothetical protein